MGTLSGHIRQFAVQRAQEKQTKFARLRVRVTGKRKPSGLPKGSPRPAAYGSGQGTRAIPALEAVYRDEQLPPPVTTPPPGERNMLEMHGVTAFAASLQQPHRVPRGKAK